MAEFASRPVAVALLAHLRRAHDHIDRNYRDALDLARLASVAGVSKYHFARSFEATYGETPMRYVTRRRIERAQSLLRAANLTVTEVSVAVGFASLGSFSSRFTTLVGETPSAYRRRWAARGEPHVPGCFLFMRGVLDQTATRDFYVDILGFTAGTDVTMGDGFRWVTVKHPNQPELELTLMTPGPPLDNEAADFVRRQLEKGGMGGVGLTVDDCHRSFAELSAKGVTFLQEPADRPYGVEAVMRDNTGNWLVLVEPKDFTADDFA